MTLLVIWIVMAEMSFLQAFRDRRMLHKNRLHDAAKVLLKRKTRRQIRVIIEKTEQQIMQ